MFAVIVTGGKQYKVQQGDVLKVEKLNAEVGTKLELPVILTSNEGKVVAGKDAAKLVCTAEVVSHGKGEKIVVYKYKAKKNVRRKNGHRQPYTEIKIVEVK